MRPSVNLIGDGMTRTGALGVVLILLAAVVTADAQGIGYGPGVNPSNPSDLTNRSNPQDLTAPGGSNRQDLVRQRTGAAPAVTSPTGVPSVATSPTHTTTRRYNKAKSQQARRRGGYGMGPEYYDRYYCGRLPAQGYDGCGHREFSYGQDSCWRRVIANSPSGLVPRRVYVCG
jgi:hypothetical protein